MHEVLQHAFAQRGWTPEIGAAIASRYIETACGPKPAFVYLYPGQVLRADYWSEGRNALATLRLMIETHEAAAVSSLVARFDAEIAHAIDGTYARGLWLIGVRPRPQAPAFAA
jgi:hypothetical protein